MKQSGRKVTQAFSLSGRGSQAESLCHFLLAALLLFVAGVPFARATDPDVASPLVSYQFLDSLADVPAQPNIVSPLVSYQFLDSLADAPEQPNVVSPLVSYQYLDWPGDENLTFQSSPSVSYYFDGAPSITVGPANQIVQAGANVTFGVGVEGTQPLSYQWRFNGVAISGAAGATLPRTNVQPGDSGSYSVRVANAHGSVVSREARLNVYLPPDTPQPPAPTLTPTGGTVQPALTAAPRTPSSTQLKVFNSGGQVDRNKMTIVLTHGWRSSADGWPTAMKSAMISKGYDAVANILAWDWSEDALTKSPSTAAARTRNQGDALGAELFFVLGVGYNKPLHFIGHSLGTILNCEAADYIHGDAKNSPAKLSGSSLKYAPGYTQMTLFDEAELVQPIKGIHVFLDVLFKPQGDTTADLINNFWTKVIPEQFAWADNYLSEVGLLHPEAANVLLWRSKYFPNQVIAQHGYAYEWYRGTIANPLGSLMGHRWSFERNSVGSAPDAPAYYLQSLDLAASEMTVSAIAGTTAGTLSVGRLAAYPSLKAYQGLNAIGTTVQGVYLGGIQYAGNVVANVAESFAPLNGEPIYVGTAGSTPAYFGMPTTPTLFQANWDFKFTLDKAGAPAPAPLAGFPVAAQALAANPTTTPFVIIPVAVPWNAVGMSFEFQFEDAKADSYMTMGIGEENYFTMEAKYVEDGEWNHSTVIDIAEFAGQEVEIFVGLNGSAATGKVNVRGIQFFSPPIPALDIAPAGPQLKLAWPLSGVDWTLETTTTLALPDSWQPVTTMPLDADYEHSVPFDITVPNQFFRLRK